MGGGGEDGHIDAGLGDDVLGADRADAVHGVELVHLAQVRGDQRRRSWPVSASIWVV